MASPVEQSACRSSRLEHLYVLNIEHQRTTVQVCDAPVDAMKYFSWVHKKNPTITAGLISYSKFKKLLN